jgi:hypothetical protein
MNATDPTPPWPAPASDPNRGKPFAALLSLAMVGAVLWPLHQNWRREPKDSFPLSYYPMFSTKRDPIETFHYIVARDQEGHRHYVPYNFVGVGGLNSVRRQLRRIVNEGRAPELAQSVARRVSRQAKEPWTTIASISVCKGTYSVEDFYHGKKEPVTEQVKGFAKVERRKHERDSGNPP